MMVWRLFGMVLAVVVYASAGALLGCVLLAVLRWAQ